MSVSAPFIRRPIATSLLMAGVLLVGLVSFPLLPVAPLPQVDFPTIQVSAAAAGRQSRKPWPPRWRRRWKPSSRPFPGVSQMTSTSVLGSTQIIVAV